MELVQYEVRDRIAHVTIANGKANALSPDVIAGLGDALSPRRGRGRGRGRRAARHRRARDALGRFRPRRSCAAARKRPGKLVTDGGELFSRMYGCADPRGRGVHRSRDRGGRAVAARRRRARRRARRVPHRAHRDPARHGVAALGRRARAGAPVDAPPPGRDGRRPDLRPRRRGRGRVPRRGGAARGARGRGRGRGAAMGRRSRGAPTGGRSGWSGATGSGDWPRPSPPTGAAPSTCPILMTRPDETPVVASASRFSGVRATSAGGDLLRPHGGRHLPLVVAPAAAADRRRAPAAVPDPRRRRSADHERDLRPDRPARRGRRRSRDRARHGDPRRARRDRPAHRRPDRDAEPASPHDGETGAD